MKEKEVKHIDLNHDLTQTDLMRLLNKKFGGKKFSTKGTVGIIQFNQQDIQGYMKRGKLPLKYGGNKISVIKNEGSTSVVFLRVKDINKLNSLPDFQVEVVKDKSDE